MEQASTTALATSIAHTSAKGAAKSLAHGVGRAAGLGAALDAGVASVEAAAAYRAGDISRGQALRHVGREAASGGLAAGAGVATAALVTVLTGGVGPGLLFTIGAGSSAAAKHALSRLWR